MEPVLPSEKFYLQTPELPPVEPFLHPGEAVLHPRGAILAFLSVFFI